MIIIIIIYITISDLYNNFIISMLLKLHLHVPAVCSISCDAQSLINGCS